MQRRKLGDVRGARSDDKTGRQTGGMMERCSGNRFRNMLPSWRKKNKRSGRKRGVNENRVGKKTCLKRHLIFLHESFRVFFYPLPCPIAGSLSFRSRFRPVADATRPASFPPHYTGNICISVYRLNIHEGWVPVSGRFARRDTERRRVLRTPPFSFSPILRPPASSVFFPLPSSLPCPPLYYYVQPALPSSASVGDWLREQLRGMEEKHECRPAFCAIPFPCLSPSFRDRVKCCCTSFRRRRGRRGSQFIYSLRDKNIQDVCYTGFQVYRTLEKKNLL